MVNNWRNSVPAGEDSKNSSAVKGLRVSPPTGTLTYDLVTISGGLSVGLLCTGEGSSYREVRTMSVQHHKTKQLTSGGKSNLVLKEEAVLMSLI